MLSITLKEPVVLSPGQTIYRIQTPEYTLTKDQGIILKTTEHDDDSSDDIVASVNLSLIHKGLPDVVALDINNFTQPQFAIIEKLLKDNFVIGSFVGTMPSGFVNYPLYESLINPNTSEEQLNDLPF